MTFAELMVSSKRFEGRGNARRILVPFTGAREQSDGDPGLGFPGRKRVTGIRVFPE